MKKTKNRHGNPRIKDLGISTQFQPGRSGNPGGRPKTRTLAEMLAAVGDQVEKKSGKTYFQLAAEALVSRASDGDVQAFREFADRIDGRATQSVELSGVNGQTIAIEKKGLWEQEWLAASFNRRQEMEAELDQTILARADEIRERQKQTAIMNARKKEIGERLEAGEALQEILSSMKTPPCGFI